MKRRDPAHRRARLGRKINGLDGAGSAPTAASAAEISRRKRYENSGIAGGVLGEKIPPNNFIFSRLI
jgi:hypothetical protein